MTNFVKAWVDNVDIKEKILKAAQEDGYFIPNRIKKEELMKADATALHFDTKLKIIEFSRPISKNIFLSAFEDEPVIDIDFFDDGSF